MSRIVSFCRLNNNTICFKIMYFLIVVLILSYCSQVIFAQESIKVRDYLEEKFDSAIFYLYLDSMDELDSNEIEFIDMLAEQTKDRQIYYGKKVYQDGFNLTLLNQLREEIRKREEVVIHKIEEIVFEEDELTLPDLPPMKFWERLYAHMVSVQKMISTTDYNRFSICGVDPARSERVVKRVKNYFAWCSEWMEEGNELIKLAEKALKEDNIFLARQLFHSAAGCYHIGAFLNYYDIEEKVKAHNMARDSYKKAISLYEEKDRPVSIEIPFREVEIPGYLILARQPNQPLIIFVNVLNNIKEVENHFYAQNYVKAGFNVFSFDGPGQGELRQDMSLIPDYEKAIHAIIDWFEINNKFNVDIERIGVIGISFGGFFSIKAAATDPRIDCVIGNGGFAYFPSLSHLKDLSIPTKRAIYYMTGYRNMKEVSKYFGHLDIKECPPLNRPMLVIQGGKDRTVPSKHAFYYMDWAIGEKKELLFIKEANHCCQDHFDLITPYTIDWFRKHLL